MSLPKYRWTLTPFRPRENFYLPRMLPDWHRAKNMGCEIQTLWISGIRVDSQSLERLNLWLQGDGAWRASLLPHFEADRVLGRILRQGGVFPLGSAGGGRWSSRSTAEEIFWDARDRV